MLSGEGVGEENGRSILYTDREPIYLFHCEIEVRRIYNWANSATCRVFFDVEVVKKLFKIKQKNMKHGLERKKKPL